MSRLEVRQVWASYEGPPILRGVDLTVDSGAIGAVLGPSGCGKSTLLRVIAGFEHPTAGMVRLGEQIVTHAGTPTGSAGEPAVGNSQHLAPEHRRVGAVPQEGALFPHLSAADNVGFGLARGTRRHRATRIAELLELVGLAGLGDRMPNQLSGGQQQRVAVARALAPEPQIVLLDEPFNALDASLRATVRADVRAALRTAGATAVLVTHDQQEALSCADVVAVMQAGRITQSGSPWELYSTPRDPSIARFLGEATMVPGRASDTDVDTALGRLALHEPAHGPGQVMIRPEQVRIHSNQPQPCPHAEGQAETPSTTGTLTRVQDHEFYGHDAKITVEVDTGDQQLAVCCRTSDADTSLTTDTTVTIDVISSVTFFPDHEADGDD